jgi:hypothetical protein
LAGDKRSVFNWDEFVTKPVITSDGKILGNVDQLRDLEFIVKDGSIDRKYYLIPRNKVNGHHDGKVWLSISEEQVKSQFARRNTGYDSLEAEIETQFLVSIRDETLSRKSNGENEPILLSIQNVASSLGFMTKGLDKQELFNSIIDSLSKKGLVERYAASAVAITSEGIKTAKKIK